MRGHDTRIFRFDLGTLGAVMIDYGYALQPAYPLFAGKAEVDATVAARELALVSKVGVHNGRQTADVMHSPTFDPEHTGWRSRVAMDPEVATATRRRPLDRAVGDNKKLCSYQFPALGTPRAFSNRPARLPTLWGFRP